MPPSRSKMMHVGVSLNWIRDVFQKHMGEHHVEIAASDFGLKVLQTRRQIDADFCGVARGSFVQLVLRNIDQAIFKRVSLGKIRRDGRVCATAKIGYTLKLPLIDNRFKEIADTIPAGYWSMTCSGDWKRVNPFSMKLTVIDEVELDNMNSTCKRQQFVRPLSTGTSMF